MSLRRFASFVALVVAMMMGVPAAQAIGANVRLTNDDPALSGYVSDYTLVTGTPYTDAVLSACSQSRGRQNEPAVAVDPRNPDVIIGSSNDYCGVFQSNGALLGLGDVWLGYYRSEDGGLSFKSSLVPGYQGDTSPYAARAHVRTADSGDPVLAWDNHGRLFAGSESSTNPERPTETFGDVWVATYENPDGPSGATTNDGKEFVRSLDVARGSAAPAAGLFHDKTAIEVDRTGGPCDGYVYFAWARFTGNIFLGPNGFNSSIYFVRSTDHGKTFSAPMKLSQTVHDIQFPDIAVTGDGHVYVTYRQFADVRSNQSTDAIDYNASTDCGNTFSAAKQVVSFEPYDPTDLSSGTVVGDCGDAASACDSGYTFMRGGTQIRSTADQTDSAHDYVYVVYDPSIPGTEVPSGTTYGSITSEDLPDRYHQDVGSQSGIYFFRLNGTNGRHTDPTLIDDPAGQGLQRFPDISVDQGSMHAIWWDSRNDPCYSPQRPLGNCADLTTTESLDAYGAAGDASSLTWSPSERLSDTSSNPNWEQFGGRTVPFGGDYIYLSSVGAFSYGVWTDWRNVVTGTDPREGAENDGADVHQCRTQNPDGSWGPDTCPWAGGLDQNIYGALTP